MPLGALLADVASNVQEGSDRGLSVEVDAREDLAVEGDRARLTEAIGSLMAAVLRERLQGARIVALARPDGDLRSALVAFGDAETAPALLDDPDARRRSFDEYRGGLGFRLPAAARIIEAHGGRLASPVAERGRLSIVMTLPATVARSGEHRVKKPYVAIVDDDSAFSNYLRTFLSLRGYETRTYSRGDELLAAIRQADPPDVVLLDVMMPGLDGLATLRALKAARPETQAIMLSGREQASTIVEAVRLGAADYVVKPDDPEGLGEIALDVAIKNALEKNRLVSELTELRQQLSDDQDRAFLFWGNSEQMRHDRRRSSSRWPTAT